MNTVPDWRRTAAPGLPLSAAMPAAALPPTLPSPAESPALASILRPEVLGRWAGWAAKDYTPERIEAILRGMIMGDHEAGWELFWMMEDTWPTLAKAVAELKRAAVQLEWEVEPWAEDDQAPTDQAKARARVVSNALWKMRPRPEEGANGFEATVMDLLDAWAKGLSVLEIEWELRDMRGGGQMVMPKSTQWVHPRHYVWGVDGRLALRLGTDEPRGWGARREPTTPFPPDRFLIGVCKARTGPILGGALLRPLAWWWCASNFSAGWLLNLAQIFGLPIRWANYAPGTSAATVNAICAMLENMGSAAWAAFPAGTQVQLLEPSKTSGSSPQDGLLDRADKQALLLILGQGLTSEVGNSGSRALGEVHLSVRDQIIQAAADWAASVLNQQLVPAILRLNFGDEEEAPEICAEPAEAKDLKADAERLAVLMPHLPIPTDWLYRTQKIPKPQEGEETVGGPAANPTPGPGAAPIPGPATSVDPSAPRGGRNRYLDLYPNGYGEGFKNVGVVSARRSTVIDPHALPDTPGRIAAAGAADLAREFRGALAPVRAILAASSSAEDFERRLQAHYADWKPARVAEVVERVFQVSAAAGAAEGPAAS